MEFSGVWLGSDSAEVTHFYIMTQFLTNEQILNKATMLFVAGRTKTILANTGCLFQSPAEVKLHCKKKAA